MVVEDCPHIEEEKSTIFGIICKRGRKNGRKKVEHS